jgi:hypothetical protein
MYTTVETSRADAAPQPRSPQVQAFFDTLRREQEHYLAAIGNARSHLGKDAAQLAQMSAVQGRLVRRFFDAQRAILERRADVDSEVAAVLAEAEERALAAIDEAQRLAASARCDLDTPDDLRTLPPPTGVPVDLAAVSLVRMTAPTSTLGPLRAGDSMGDLARVIDDAFAPGQVGGPAYEQQLDAVLDEWWAAERQESKALVDDAHARAAVRMHMANVRAHELLAALGVPSPGSTSMDREVAADVDMSAALPASFADVLTGADAADLDQLLEHLLADLRAPIDARDLMSNDLQPIDAAIITLGTDSDGLSAPDAFQRFWSEPVIESVAERAPRRWSWIPTQVILPIAAVTAGLTAVMAWIG